jgi:hypothetical protein
MVRVLYVHALVAAPRLALGRLAPLGRVLGDPRLGVRECSCHCVAFSHGELGEPRLLELTRDGNPIYAWPFEERHVWRAPPMPSAGRALERATRSR